MNLSLPTINLEKYKSASQRARVGTESWGSSNFFCSSCESPRLEQTSRNTATIDFACPICKSTFQLKSQSTPVGARIVDAAYSQMKRAILEDRTPNLFVLHYDLAAWTVRTVVLIPRFAFALSALERRKPLSHKARRAGWVGCNILLGQIPQDARIPVIQDGIPRPPSEVRQAYQRLRPLENLKVEQRGWTLDVLEIVRSLGRSDFTLREIYSHAGTLARLHPHNSHVHDKIRQQLQVLRDLGLLIFLGSGSYRLA
jgi:type II restriction enzyme